MIEEKRHSVPKEGAPVETEHSGLHFYAGDGTILVELCDEGMELRDGTFTRFPAAVILHYTGYNGIDWFNHQISVRDVGCTSLAELLIWLGERLGRDKAALGDMMEEIAENKWPGEGNAGDGTWWDG